VLHNRAHAMQQFGIDGSVEVDLAHDSAHGLERLG
jgi:hypothetical protein